MGAVVERRRCPSCANKGRDRKGDNLAVYDDDSVYCHSCGYYENSKTQNRRERKMEKVDISKYASYPIRELEHKPISEEIAKRYGVRTVLDPENGKPKGILYPYYHDNQVIGYKARTLPKTFAFRGDSSKVGLFGQNLYDKGGRMLLVTEGEDDALSIAEMLHQRGKHYSVVSIPNGADQNGTLDAKVKAQYDYLASFKTVVIAFDNDNPGRMTANAMAEWLAPSTTVRVLNYPEGYKDAGDMLAADRIDEFLKTLYNAPEFSPAGIIKSCDIDIQKLKKSPERGYSTPYTALDDKLKGMRKGELVLFTAGSGIGKSTMVREIGYHFVKEHGLSVANIMIEEPTEKSQLGYIALDNNVPLSRLWMDRTAVPDQQFDMSAEALLKNDRNHFFYHFGSISNEELMNAMRYYANALDVDFILLDHISMVVSGQATDNERKTIDLLMTDLAAFCNETKVGVLAVVHLKRKNTGGKEKSLNEGGQVSLTDLRGSGGLEQMSWSVVALERNQQDAEESNFSTVRVLKNRMFGFTGKAGRLYYDPETGRLLEAPEPLDYTEE